MKSGAIPGQVVSENQGTGRGSRSAGMVNRAGLVTGVSEHSQIKDSHESLGMGSGQGWRPKDYPSKSLGNRGFKIGPT